MKAEKRLPAQVVRIDVPLIDSYRLRLGWSKSDLATHSRHGNEFGCGLEPDVIKKALRNGYINPRGYSILLTTICWGVTEYRRVFPFVSDETLKMPVSLLSTQEPSSLEHQPGDVGVRLSEHAALNELSCRLAQSKSREALYVASLDGSVLARIACNLNLRSLKKVEHIAVKIPCESIHEDLSKRGLLSDPAGKWPVANRYFKERVGKEFCGYDVFATWKTVLPWLYGFACRDVLWYSKYVIDSEGHLVEQGDVCYRLDALQYPAEFKKYLELFRDGSVHWYPDAKTVRKAVWNHES